MYCGTLLLSHVTTVTEAILEWTKLSFGDVFLFSSPAEKAYELARGTFSNSNSIFVQAMKDHFQEGSGSLQSTVQNLLNSIAKGQGGVLARLFKSPHPL